MPENALNNALPVANLYITQQRPDYRRWRVNFVIYREGSDHYAEKEYSCIVDENREVIGDPDTNSKHVKDRAAEYKNLLETPVSKELEVYRKYAAQAEHNPFWQWPYELKAAYSQEILPIVSTMEAMDQEVGISSWYAYGFPADNAIQHDDAVTLAHQSVMKTHGLSNQEMNKFTTVFEFYDITDTENPLWKFTFINPDDYYGVWYRVELNALSSQVVRVDKAPWQPRDRYHQDWDLQWLF